MAAKRANSNSSDQFRFRVSDALAVPLRGFMLRLRLLEGEPAMRDLGPGTALRLRAPNGDERTVHVQDFSLTSGRPTQEVFDRNRQIDVIIPEAEAIAIWERESGLRVDPSVLAWWKLFSAVKGCAIWTTSAREFVASNDLVL